MSSGSDEGPQEDEEEKKEEYEEPDRAVAHFVAPDPRLINQANHIAN